MNISSVPTDNLYKFEAVASLVFIVLWVYASVNVHDRSERSQFLADLATERITLLGKEADAGNQAFRDAEAELRSVYAEMSQLGKSSPEWMASYEKSQPLITKLESAYKDSHDSYDRLIKESDSTRVVLHDSIRDITADEIVVAGGGIVAFVAFLFMLHGFFNWRIRVQQPLDRLLSLDLEVKELEVKKLRSLD